MNTLKKRFQAVGAVTAATLLLTPLGTVAYAAPATPTEYTIQQIQGNGAESPLVTGKKGPLVSVKGRVTSVNNTDTRRKGFFIQTPGTGGNVSDEGSHGLFVSVTKSFKGQIPNVDQCVTVVGEVSEMGSGNRLTRLTSLKSVTPYDTDCMEVPPIELTSIPSADELEKLESMLVRPAGNLKVTSTSDLAERGIIELAFENAPEAKIKLDDNVLSKLSGGTLPFSADPIEVGDSVTFTDNVVVDADTELRLQSLAPVNGVENSPITVTKVEKPAPPAGDGNGTVPGTGDTGENTQPPAPAPAGELTQISAIQGTGFKSPMENQVVTVKGVVTARYDHGNLDGFYLQTPGTGATKPANGSEAIFVYLGKNHLNTLPALNSCVTVKGTVKEFTSKRKNVTDVFYTTQLNSPEVKSAENCEPVTALELNQLPTTDEESEAIEGMLIKPTQKLIVTDNYQLNTFGTVGLSKTGELLHQATDVARPGAEAQAIEAQNTANYINLDDGISWNYSSEPKAGQTDPRDYKLPYVTKTTPVRLGANVTFNSGVIYEYRFGWVLQPTQPVHEGENSPVTFENNRPTAAPVVNGDVKIATYNVLNYFVNLGKDNKCQYYTDRHGTPVTSKGCGVRGAYNETAFHNQQVKIVTAINKLAADVVGLEEVENSVKFKKERDFALAHLVSELNKANNGAIQWDYVRSPQNVPNGGDAIRTAFIYNTAKVKPVGESQILDNAVFNNIARSPLAQTFTPVVTEQQTGTEFVVMVNHFKSKRPPEKNSNPDQADKGDGQGGFNAKRVEQAQAVAQWADTTFAGKPVYMIGDFNSYSKEDPIIKLAELGYNKITTEGHSYLFGGRVGSLDHAITNAAGLALVNGNAKVWEINAHEPVALEYSRKNYTASDLYAADEYRSSDHNPEIFGINVIKPKDTTEVPEDPKPGEPGSEGNGSAGNGSDAGNDSGNGSNTGTGSETDNNTGDQPAAPAVKTIAEIQGTGFKSALEGSEVTTKGVVTAAYRTGNFNGFYIQTPGSGAETNPTASHAIFVYVGQKGLDMIPELNACVEVTGTVAEYGGKNATEDYEYNTQLTSPKVKAAQDCTPVTPIPLTELPADAADREKYEGMLVAPTGPITVTDNYGLGQYGTLTLAYGDEALVQPTDKFAPGSAEAIALAAANEAKEIKLDDGASWDYQKKPGKKQNYDPRSSALPYLTLESPIRVGAAVTFTDSVIFEYRFGWVFQPRQQVIGTNHSPVTFANNRPAVPAVNGDVKVATFNVLNYFTDLGENEVGCKSYKDRADKPIGTNRCKVRGAYSADAFNKQKTKIVAAISALNADVISLEEIENTSRFNNQGRDVALQNLVDALNEKMGADTWKAVASPANVPNNGDAIRTAFIYKPAKVTPEGDSVILNHSDFTGVARSPLAQKFTPVVKNGETGTPFVLIVNHFKSKGSVANGHGEQEGDFNGQGNNNPLRVKQAQALGEFAKANYADVPTFLLGDFNAYSKEEPITALEKAGYAKLAATGHSYVFKGRSGSLDHVLANPAAAALVSDTGVQVWEINAHEPVMLEYARHNYNVTNLYAPDQWRSSDHNPEVFGINVIKPKDTPEVPELPKPSEPGADATPPVKPEGTPLVPLQPADPVKLDLKVSAASYTVGEELNASFTILTGTDLKEVVFELHSDPVKLGQRPLIKQADGSLLATVAWRIPADFPAGLHHLVVKTLDGVELARQPIVINRNSASGSQPPVVTPPAVPKPDATSENQAGSQSENTSKPNVKAPVNEAAKTKVTKPGLANTGSSTSLALAALALAVAGTLILVARRRVK